MFEFTCWILSCFCKLSSNVLLDAFTLANVKGFIIFSLHHKNLSFAKPLYPHINKVEVLTKSNQTSNTHKNTDTHCNVIRYLIINQFQWSFYSKFTSVHLTNSNTFFPNRGEILSSEWHTKSRHVPTKKLQKTTTPKN